MLYQKNSIIDLYHLLKLISSLIMRKQNVSLEEKWVLVREKDLQKLNRKMVNPRPKQNFKELSSFSSKVNIS